MLLIYLYLITLLIRPQDWVPFLLGWPVNDVIVSLALIIGFWQCMKEPGKYSIVQGKLLILYLIVIFISSLTNGGYSSAIEQFITYLKRSLIFFMVIWNLNTKEKLYKSIVFILLLTAILGYQAIEQVTTGVGWGGVTPHPQYQEIRIRWHGDWDGPNAFAILFLISICLSLEFVTKKNNFFVRIASSAMLGLYTFGLYFTNSRGAILALIASLVFYFREKLTFKMAVIISVIAVSLILSFGPSRVALISSSEESANERTWLWEQGLKMLIENPMLGIGRGFFKEYSEKNLVSHNNYVQNAAETGLLGYFSWISILWFSFKGNYITKKIHVDSRLLSLNISMNTVLIGYCVVTFFVVMEQDLLFFLFGLFAATYLVTRNESKDLLSLSITKFDFAAVILVGIAILFIIWIVANKLVI